MWCQSIINSSRSAPAGSGERVGLISKLQSASVELRSLQARLRCASYPSYPDLCRRGRDRIERNVGDQALAR
jgi:hypothetical protein